MHFFGVGGGGAGRGKGEEKKITIFYKPSPSSLLKNAPRCFRKSPPPVLPGNKYRISMIFMEWRQGDIYLLFYLLIYHSVSHCWIKGLMGRLSTLKHLLQLIRPYAGTHFGTLRLMT
jgi:hypothetical protein